MADKDLARNRLIVVQGHDHPALLKSDLRNHRRDLDWRANAETGAMARRHAIASKDAACNLRMKRTDHSHCSFHRRNGRSRRGSRRWYIRVRCVWGRDYCLGLHQTFITKLKTDGAFEAVAPQTPHQY